VTIKTPFFSDKDEDLIKGDIIRDHMGTLPVWSAVARGLVPHLANTISNIKGIIAVLYIYSFDKHFLNEKNEAKFKQYFRLMEGLFEYYLAYEAGSNIKPCFGKRLLTSSQKDSVRIYLDDRRTFANGLHQYYRGTCRRASLISDNWVLNEEVDRIIYKTYFESNQNAAITLLNNELTKILKKNDLKEMNPSKLFENGLIGEHFKSLFDNHEIRDHLQNAFYGDKNIKYYAQSCNEVIKNHSEDSKTTDLEELATYINENNMNWSYFHQLENQLYCEPFLSTIVDCFNLIQVFTGDKINSVSDFLVDTHEELSRKATLFLKLKTDFSGGRFDDLYVIAEHASRQDIQLFLISLIDYQKNIMARRDKGPMVIIEGGLIQKLTDYVVNDKDEILKNIKRLNPMRNNYFIRTTASIYKQLFEATGSEH
jgi:hypothetical protein